MEDGKTKESRRRRKGIYKGINTKQIETPIRTIILDAKNYEVQKN